MSNLTAGPETFPPRDLNHSVRIDISLSSDGGAVTDLCRHLLASCFDGLVRKSTEKHLLTLLANLYAAWDDDPTLAVALSMTNSGYKAKSRYNPVKVSNQLIQIVNRLAELGFLHGATGFSDPRSGVGRTSRVWPSDLLAALFSQARLQGASCLLVAETEVLILKSSDGRAVEYDDTSATRAMRSALRAYNSLLERTFIDIPELDHPGVPLSSGGSLRISQRDKLVRRVFNRGSWDKGGRFYGGWWQNCPKSWRQRIYINDQPTIEDDYSGLHVVMLYAWKGIDYWAKFGPGEDPYRIDCPPDFVGDVNQCRAYAKSLLLMAINADTDKAAFGAFRAGMRDRKDPIGATFKDAQLTVMLDALKAKHAPIAEYIGAGAGIDLMNQDAMITGEIIRSFVEARRPILTIHDSYIVMFGDDQRLADSLRAAFTKVTGVTTSHRKRVGVGYGEVSAGRPTELDADKIDLLTRAVNQTRSRGYLERLESFHSS